MATTEAPIHYRYNGQLYCPAVDHAVTELRVNQNGGKFAGLTKVDNSAVAEVTTSKEEQKSESLSSCSHNSQQEQRISPNPKTRAFLEDFNMYISQIMNGKDLALSSNVLQSLSNFQHVYEDLKNTSGSPENDNEIEIIEISDDEDEPREPDGMDPGVEIIVISDDEEDRNENNEATAQYCYYPAALPYSLPLLSTTSFNITYSYAQPISPLNVRNYSHAQPISSLNGRNYSYAQPISPLNVRNIEPLPGTKKPISPLNVRNIEPLPGTKKPISPLNVRNIEPLPGTKINRYPTLPIFKNPILRKVALTHSNMNKTVGCNYERLEYLGDRVLQHLANQMAFDRVEKHPTLRQNKKRIMNHIEAAINFFVTNKTLAVIGHILDIRTLVIKEVGGPLDLSTKDMADYVEALIGALYEDNNRNFDAIREWYEPITGTLLDRILYKLTFESYPIEQDVFDWAYDMYFHLNKRFTRAAP
ncbi:11427_t:CDS:2 [Ambispora leptoticha]|uniref:11427_t:CDS:1 n=1 Tax=Ambispora leptoticha TaxID=144679 RepID=A0A9N9ETW0_9GLOM|nr:11427_t:CDS:2 [Ambispora leptoticha]